MFRRPSFVVMLAGACNNGPAEEITFSQTQSTSVTGGNWCGAASDPTGPTAENSFFRVFELDDFGVQAGFRIATLTVGVDQAAKPAGAEFVLSQLIVHEYTGPIGESTLDVSAMRVLATRNLGFSDSPKGTDHRSGFALNEADDIPIDIDASVRVIAVELYNPRVPTNDRTFRIGINSLGETAPSYHRCPSAPDLAVPTSLAALGFANSHAVLQLTGFEIPDPGSDIHQPL